MLPEESHPSRSNGEVTKVRSSHEISTATNSVRYELSAEGVGEKTFAAQLDLPLAAAASWSTNDALSAAVTIPALPMSVETPTAAKPVAEDVQQVPATPAAVSKSPSAATSTAEVSTAEVLTAETNSNATDGADQLSGECVEVAETGVATATHPPTFSDASNEADVVSAAEPDLFAELGLAQAISSAVRAAGYSQPTPIQAEVIPAMLAGRDVVAQSQTGSGKTAAFALPILSQLDAQMKQPQVLVLAPTRELAIQVARSFKNYAENVPKFSVVAIYGGQDYEIQLRALKRGVQVIVGTPGRVIDHINRGTLDLSQIRTLVLDEADEMLNMGFLEDVQFILAQAPEGRRVALFSATMPPPIRKIADTYLRNPAQILVRQRTMTADSIEQLAMGVEPHTRLSTLLRVLEVENSDATIVFTKTREDSVQVAEALNQAGHSAVALNGDIPQKVRERTIEQFKSGRIDVLVATDVAARGLDVPRISHVINFDLPEDSESYIHRIGRTGRAGRAGKALIFLTKKQRGKLKAIEKLTRQQIQWVTPPSVAEVNAARVRKFEDRLAAGLADPQIAAYRQMLTELAAQRQWEPLDLAAVLAHWHFGERGLWWKATAETKDLGDRQEFEDRRRERGGRRDARSNSGSLDEADRGGKSARRKSGPPAAGMQRYRIEVGRIDGVRPGNIVGAVANEAGIDGSAIGHIQIHDQFSTVDLPAGMPDEICAALQETWVAGKQLQIRLWTADLPETPAFRRRQPAGPGRFAKGPRGERTGRPERGDRGARGPQGGGKKKFGKRKGFSKFSQ